MTPHDDDLELGRELKAQEALYDEVLDSNGTTHAVDFLARALMLCEIADIDTAKDFIHKPEGSEAVRREWDDLDDEGRKEVTEIVAQHWSLNVNLAVRRLWHAAKVLGFQPTRSTRSTSRWSRLPTCHARPRTC
jgi:hypothetical protein